MHRDDYWAGVSQNVPIEPNKQYYFSLMMKIIEDVPGYMFHKLDVLIEVDYEDGTVA